MKFSGYAQNVKMQGSQDAGKNKIRTRPSIKKLRHTSLHLYLLYMS